MLRILIIGITMSTAFAALAYNSEADAERLVSAMKFDQSALVGMQISAKHSFQKGKTSRKVLDCVMSRTRRDFTPLFARIYRSLLSPSEVLEAVAYFESPSGKNYTAIGITQLYRRFNEVPPEPAPSLTAADESSLVLFYNSPTGKKLFGLKVAEMPETKHAIQMKILDVIETCKRE